ncbi:MAG: hypothetical protein ACNS60_01155 [Candidatus Cyclobacteriaceae bacterium M2_1C_046]
MRKLLLILFIYSPFALQAQQINPKGKFLTDSIKLGMEVQYSLSVRYPRELDIVFPDSTFDYSPLEFESKKYFPTTTDSLYSYDSVIYTLTTFEVDSIQYLQLPIFVVSGGDSSSFYPAEDSIILHHVVKEIPDTVEVDKLALKENTSYLPLSLQFNYPYLIIGIIIFVITGLLILIIFGKRIRKWWQLKRLRKQYHSFKEKFENIKNNPEYNKPEVVLEALSVWKKYMEKLTSRPYRQLTTKEIYIREKEEALRESLRQADRAVYSGKASTGELQPYYQELESYANKQFNIRAEEIKNA